MSISIGQIDLEALKNYLKIVQGFRTVDDPSGDTDLVNGIPSDKIAIAALNEAGDLIVQGEDEEGKKIGRTIVDNALNLARIDVDGNLVIINANDVLTESEGQELKATAITASKNTAEDMRSLRNEMYHLKLDMIKSGSVQYNNVYNGFIDPFIQSVDGLELFTTDPVNLEGVDGNKPVASSGDFDAFYKEGQNVVLVGDSVVAGLDKIIKDDSGALVLEKAQFSKTPDLLKKSFGMYYNGKFVFAGDGSMSVDTNNTINMIYKDGADRISVMDINESISQKGFVSVITVPAELDNSFLKSISVSLRVEGAPGVCYCELYDYKALDKVQNRIFGEPIASSKNVGSANVSSTNFTTHHFALDNEVLLEKGQMYVLVVKANGTSTGNVWRIGGFTEVCNNNIHQDTYIYNTDGSLTPQTADMLSNQILDMFIGLGTSQIKEHNLSYSKQGIYTGTFEIENDAASRVRISFNPDRNGKELIEFNVHDYYKVNVIGKIKNSDEFVKGIPNKIDELGNHVAKVYSHRILAAGQLSAYEYVYDFDFGGQEVDLIEFQIVYNSINAVGEDAHGALYAVVVSTDNAFLGKEE